MKAKKRFLLLLLVCVAFLCLSYFGSFAPSLSMYSALFSSPPSPQSLTARDWLATIDHNTLPTLDQLATDPEPQLWPDPEPHTDPPHPSSSHHCTMQTCFNMSRCRNRPFRVHVYPPLNDTTAVSALYRKFLQVIIDSPLYTSDARLACVFVPSVDTLDGDPLSTNYVADLQRRLHQLPLWHSSNNNNNSGGANHVLFNLFSGTWPDYRERLPVDTGHALLAKASVSDATFRHGFDISLPLVPQNHPEHGGDDDTDGDHTSFPIPAKKRHLIGFKGKRYVYGIGSRTRNALYHLHNGASVVAVTTCRHGTDWQKWKDDRCDSDAIEYDKYSYASLLTNSTLCLVPRGRRVGSFRFLEVLRAGCVPLILANGWRLPFDEVIDWRAAVVWADERLLLQVPAIARSVADLRLLLLRQQARLLYTAYFSSVQRVVMTTLKIIEQRVHSELSSATSRRSVWMSSPGALLHAAGYDERPCRWPVFQPTAARRRCLRANYTAVVYVCGGASSGGGGAGRCDAWKQSISASFTNLLSELGKSKFLARALLLFPPSANTSYLSVVRRLRVRFAVPFRVLFVEPSQRYAVNSLIETDAILLLDHTSVVPSGLADSLYLLWREMPDRLVGMVSGAHQWHVPTNEWQFSDDTVRSGGGGVGDGRHYSLVLPPGVMYHNYYHHVYSQWSTPAMLRTVQQHRICQDILMNFIVSHVTKRPPVMLAQTAAHNQLYWTNNSSLFGESDWRQVRHICLNTLAALFGHMPLRNSSVCLSAAHSSSTRLR